MVPFTQIALGLIVLGRCVQLDLYAVGYCLIWGVAASFACAPALDPTAYSRLAVKKHMHIWAFHAGNLAVHALPLVCAPRPPHLCVWHGVMAACVHLTWGLLCGEWLLRLDRVYVPMAQEHWWALWVVAVGTELLWASWR